MLKTKLSDYKTKEVEIFTEDGESVKFEVRSVLSREFRDALSEYHAIIEHAKENDIPLSVEEKVNHGLGVVVDSTKPSEFAIKATAILMSSLVVKWPLDSDLKQDLMDSPDVMNLIDITATELSKEFNSKKKH